MQVLYHGYMGTSGASYMDLYMADAVIVPPEHARAGFSESLMMLPECFLGPSHRCFPHSHLLPPRIGAGPAASACEASSVHVCSQQQAILCAYARMLTA